MKEILLKSKFIFFIRIMIEQLHYAYLYARHMVNRNAPNTQSKIRADLSIRAHALEKGMSIGQVKVGFGKCKAIALISDLQKYIEIYGKDSFVKELYSVIAEYIKYNTYNGADMKNIQSILDKLELNKDNESFICKSGVLEFTHEQIIKETSCSYDKFSQSRYSVRDFGDNIIPLSDIEKALKLCERTPSACNRQSWKIHILKDRKLRNQLFELQLGCNGFYEKMQYAILICGDLSCYGFPEFNQAYVDGGLYAMNLMYALNYFDIATIPLTMQHKYTHTKKIKKIIQLSPNEIPVLLIGVGSYKDKFKVACSMRKTYTEYTTIHQ